MVLPLGNSFRKTKNYDMGKGIPGRGCNSGRKSGKERHL